MGFWGPDGVYGAVMGQLTIPRGGNVDLLSRLRYGAEVGNPIAGGDGEGVGDIGPQPHNRDGPLAQPHRTGPEAEVGARPTAVPWVPFGAGAALDPISGIGAAPPVPGFAPFQED